MIKAVVFDFYGVLYGPGSREVYVIVRRLRPHYKVGLLSNGDLSTVQQLLNAQGVAPLFNAVVVSSEIQVTKPDPRSYAAIALRLEVNMEEMVFVDDIPRYVTAANALGIRGVVYRSAAQLETELRQVLPVY